MDGLVKKKLVKLSSMKRFMYGKKNIKVLVISMENTKVDKIDMVSKLFTNYNNIYKCIVIRDIINLLSSRIHSEKK